MLAAAAGAVPGRPGDGRWSGPRRSRTPCAAGTPDHSGRGGVRRTEFVAPGRPARHRDRPPRVVAGVRPGRRAVRDPDPGLGGQLRAVPGDLQGYREGSVGWAADQPTFHLPDGTALALRLTAVFRHEAGEWRCVQWHVSVGVGNEETVGRGPDGLAGGPPPPSGSRAGTVSRRLRRVMVHRPGPPQAWGGTTPRGGLELDQQLGEGEAGHPQEGAGGPAPRRRRRGPTAPSAPRKASTSVV